MEIQKALINDDIYKLKDLISKGFDLSEKSAMKNSILCCAKSDEAACLLIDAGVDVFYTNPDGLNLLHMLIAENFHEALKKLVEKGVDINGRNRFEETPIHFYAKVCKYEETKTFLSHLKKHASLGVDFRLVNKRDQGVIQMACQNKSSELVNAFLHFDVDQSVIMDFGGVKSPLLFGMTDTINKFKRAVSNGADINLVDYHEETVVFSTIKLRNPSLTKFLIKKGIDLNHENKGGRTPLIVAADKMETSQFFLLLEEPSVNFEYVNKKGESILDLMNKIGKQELTSAVERKILNSSLDDEEYEGMSL